MAKNSLIRIVGVFIILSLASFICFGETDEQPKTLSINMASPGFSPSMTYQNFGNGESVNTASGGLTVVHNSSLSLPQNMGASLNFTRVYNSKSSKDAYKDNGSASDEVYPNWGFLGPGWKLSFGRVFLRVVRNTSAGTNVAAYFYEDEYGAEYRLYAVGADNQTFENDWIYGEASAPIPHDDKWYRSKDGSFILARFTQSAVNLSESYWTIYFPDGSKKICGGNTNAFVFPEKSALSGCLQNGTCPYCRNEEINGWYATTLLDKAGNDILITYYAYNNNPNNGDIQPYAGSIDTIVDQFGRTIDFEIWDGDQSTQSPFTRSGLLKSITYPDGAVEHYNYSDSTPYVFNNTVSSVMLSEVVDPVGLETLYGYVGWTGASGLERAYLTTIHYPTGATSEYIHTHITEISGNNATSVGDVVSEKKLYVGTSNVLKWSWDRSFSEGPHLGDLPGDLIDGFPVIVKDPYGVQEAHCFQGTNLDNAGVEYYVIRFNPGTVINNSSMLSSPEANASSISMIQQKYWDFRTQKFGGAFVNRACTKEYEEGTLKWQTTTLRMKYDGYGHYRRTLSFEGDLEALPNNPSFAYKESAQIYDYDYENSVLPVTNPPTENAVFDLTRLETSYSGGKEYIGGLLKGDFKVSSYLYDSHGLPEDILEYYTQQENVLYTSDDDPIDTPDNWEEEPSDQLALPPDGAFRQTSVDSYLYGNPTQITYSNSNNSGNTYTQIVGWDHGVVVNSEWIGNVDSSYQDFSRVINPNNGQIDSETLPNNLVTHFYYDAVGRIKKIQPPGGEKPTTIDYPPGTTTRGNEAWTTGHVIRLYKGDADVLQVAGVPSGGTINLPDLEGLDTYTYYEFDDLGRLWRTSTVMPDNTWSCTEKHYDPLGGVCFESMPFKVGSLSSGSVGFPVAGGSSYSITLPQNNAKYYGAWTTPFSNGTFDFPLTGDLDPFYRTRWVLRPGDVKTRTDYYGLRSDVTVFGIKTGSTTTTDSTTKYYKDIFGRLVQVDAPDEGADAVYTYNGLDRMIKAVIGTGQTRTFEYNALGQLLQSVTPERGTINYLEYDARGNLLKMSDALSGGSYTLDYTYDGRGRATELRKSNSSYPLKAWEYDSNYLGRISKAISYGTAFGEGYASNTEEYLYEGATGRLSQKNVSDMGKTFTVSYDYDDYGMVESETRGLGQGNSTIDYGYLHGRLDSALFADSQRGAHKINYHPSGGIKEICISEDYAKKISYGEEAQTGRLSSIDYAAGGWTTGTYSYDSAGNIYGIGNNNYYHDSLLRLTAAEVENPQQAGTTPSKYDFSYTYDAYGNMTERDVTVENPLDSISDLGRFSASYVNNRFTALSYPDTNSSESIDSSYYDANGNQLKFNGITYTYDVLNRLKTGNGGGYVYYYGADDERIAQISKRSLIDGESTYYLKEGGATTGELHYKIVSSSTTSIREKYFLYVGGNMLASSEKEYSFTRYNVDTGVPDPVDVSSISRICPTTYAVHSQLISIVSLSDAVSLTSKGMKYDITYNLENVSDDLAGVMIMLERIKEDPGANGRTEHRRHHRRHRERDKRVCLYYLKGGMDADFVFGRFGLKDNQNYGQITTLSSGQTYPVVFRDLMKDRSYCITLYAWTSWGADPNLGYNLMKIEDGELFVPRDEDSTYFEMRSRIRPEGNDFKSKLCAKWGAKSEANGYNVVAENGDGSRVILGAAGSSSTSLEIDGDQAVSLGVSEETSYLLEGVIIEGPIVIGGPIRDRIIPILCDPNPIRGWAVPVITQAELFVGAGAFNVAYIKWDTLSRRAPQYKVYRRIIEDLDGSGNENDADDETAWPYEEVGVTANDYYTDPGVSLPETGRTLYYKVEPVDTNNIPLASKSSAMGADLVSGIHRLQARNISTGDGTRSVLVTWSNIDARWTPAEAEDFSFAEGSGLSYEILRAYQSSANCPTGSLMESSKQGCFTEDTFYSLGTSQEASYTDTAIAEGDAAPLAFYKVRLLYDDGETHRTLIEGSACDSTFVDRCYGVSGTLPVTGSWSQLGDPLLPYITVSWTPPAEALANPADYRYDVYVDGMLWTDYDNGIINQQSVILDIFGETAGEQHTIEVSVTNLCTGCILWSDAVTTTIPDYTTECPATEDYLSTGLHVVGPASGENVAVQLFWSGTTGEKVQIYRSFTGNAGDFEELAVVDAADRTFDDDTLLTGQTAYYFLRGVTYTSETAFCKKSLSPIMKVETTAMAGQQTGTVYFYVRDHLGSSRLVLDSTGNILSKFNYEPYGVELPSPTGNVTNEKYKYTGQERDYDTGMDYMHFRYYGSNIGRFMKPDNMITNVMNPQSWNLYSYVNNSPINANDPSGHAANQSMAQAKLAPPGGCAWEISAGYWQWNPGQSEGGSSEGGSSEGEMKLTDVQREWQLIDDVWWYMPFEEHWEGPEMTVTGGYEAGHWEWVGERGHTVLKDPYLDVNLGAGSNFLAGLTGGFQTDKRTLKNYPYLGVSLTSPGLGSSIMGSDSSITPGWNVGIQAQYLISYQIGLAGGEFFIEKGFGFPGSVSLSAYYIFDPDKMREAPPTMPLGYQPKYRKAFAPW